jgi:hypothetical protein
MTDVVAGSGHQRVAPGTSGIVTLWVRATSSPIALSRAERILANSHYASVGSLSIYLEEPEDDSLQALIDAAKLTDAAEDAVVSGYRAIKQQALQQADGLFEAWLSESDQRSTQPPAESVAA